MKVLKISLITLNFFILVSGGITQTCHAQGLWEPYRDTWSPFWIGTSFYLPFIPMGGPSLLEPNMFSSLYLPSSGWGNAFRPTMAPTPMMSVPYQRAPHATIIFLGLLGRIDKGLMEIF